MGTKIQGNCCGAEEHTSPIPKNSSVNEELALHQAVCRTPSSTKSTAQAYNQGHHPAPKQDKLGK